MPKGVLCQVVVNDPHSISTYRSTIELLEKTAETRRKILELTNSYIKPGNKGKCSYPPCKSKRQPDMSFYRFPNPVKDKERALQWAVNTGVPKLIEEATQRNPKLHIKRLCCLHFERPSFLNDLKKKLTKFAIPTLFEHKESTTTSNSCTISSSSSPTENDTNNCEHITVTKNTEQFSSSKSPSKLNYTLAEVIAETVGLDNNDDTQEYFYDDEDLPEILSDTIPAENVEELYAVEIDLTKRNDDCDVTEDIQEYINFDDESIQCYTASTLPEANANSLRVNKTTSKETLCRLCTLVVPRSQLVDIFGKLSTSKEYLRKMNQLLPPSEQPVKDDVLPQSICNACCERLDYCDLAIHDFVAASVKLNRMFSTKLSKKHRALMEQKNAPTSLRVDDGNVGDGSVIKEIRFRGEPFEEQLFHIFDYATNQESSAPNKAEILNEGVNEGTNMHQRHNPRKRREVPSTYSKLVDMCEFKCSQCKYVFLNKLSLFHHELAKHTLNITVHSGKAAYELNVVKNAQRDDNFDMSETLDSEDSRSFSENNLVENIESTVDMKDTHIEYVELDPPLEASSNPKLIKVESGVEASNTTFEGLETNRSNTPSFRSLKRRRSVSKFEQFEGKIIQSSHMTIPTSSDNKTFLCNKCDISFHSIESALTHRFKEHAEEEILAQRPKLNLSMSHND